MYQNAADSGGRGWSEWSLQRRPFQCVLGQASKAFSSMSIVAPNCCQRAVLHNGFICMPPSVIMIDRLTLQLIHAVAPDRGGTYEDRGQRIRHGRCAPTRARALNQVVDARTQWSAPRPCEQPGRHTQGDSPRRTNVWSLDTYRR